MRSEFEPMILVYYRINSYLIDYTSKNVQLLFGCLSFPCDAIYMI